MEEFVKEIFYAYPLLKTVDKDYQDHIKNQAVLSYRSGLATERLAEYLVEEIIQRQRFVWLKSKVEEVLNKLDELERTMVAVRYFGKKRSGACLANVVMSKWGERKYFREQERLGNKLSVMLTGAGVSEALFVEWFASTELFCAVRKRASLKAESISGRERRWLE